MIESDVATEAIESINSNLKQKLETVKIPRSEDRASLVKQELKSAIRETFSKTKKVNVIELAKEKVARNRKDRVGPFIILFLGINGTGKTTTVARFARLLQKNALSVVIACADTHRAGAFEQMMQQAK